MRSIAFTYNYARRILARKQKLICAVLTSRKTPLYFLDLRRQRRGALLALSDPAEVNDEVNGLIFLIRYRSRK